MVYLYAYIVCTSEESLQHIFEGAISAEVESQNIRIVSIGSAVINIFQMRLNYTFCSFPIVLSSSAVIIICCVALYLGVSAFGAKDIEHLW